MSLFRRYCLCLSIVVSLAGCQNQWEEKIVELPFFNTLLEKFQALDAKIYQFPYLASEEETVKEKKTLFKELQTLKPVGVLENEEDPKLLATVLNQLENGNYHFILKIKNDRLDKNKLFDHLCKDLYGHYYGITLKQVKMYVSSKKLGETKVLFAFQLHHNYQQDQAVKQWAKDFSSKLAGLPPYMKVRRIHDQIIQMSTYYQGSSREVDGISIYSPYAILKKGTGVCQAYAALFQILCDQAGIPCLSRTGTAYQPEQTNSPIAHAWNLVYVNGEWLGIDTTWDDPVDLKNPKHQTLRYDYFLVDLSATHFPDDTIH
ncbi:transglutaminase domain-containing protein [Aerococcus christensenii]|uniref:transglutaminase domain-containing protein n=1 Tax=Aerococcus christensenii TaxID=87541 RepID=UPI0023A9EAC2|nr:transglutaminase domain-containing protein [Aerococcus christensenii]WEB70991.1 transglutaminase domain-containing protein [Aerococcus christensenii]